MATGKRAIKKVWTKDIYNIYVYIPDGWKNSLGPIDSMLKLYTQTLEALDMGDESVMYFRDLEGLHGIEVRESERFYESSVGLPWPSQFADEPNGYQAFIDEIADALTSWDEE